MKKVLSILLVLVMIFSMTGCGGSADSGSSAVTEEKTILDLQGTWKQTNGSEDSWQEAVIAEKVIEIYWVSDGGDTKSLYWAGTYDAPTTSDDSFAWESSNDKSLTDSALLASGDDTKKISYEKGVMSYSASALGTSKTVKLEKISDDKDLLFSGNAIETSSSSEDEEVAGDNSSSTENTGSDIYVSSMPSDEATIVENIAIETEDDEDGEMAVFITNNNSFVIPDLEMQVIFYKDGNLVNSDKDGHDVVLPGSTVVSRIDRPDSYDNFEVKVDVDWSYGDENTHNYPKMVPRRRLQPAGGGSRLTHGLR